MVRARDNPQITAVVLNNLAECALDRGDLTATEAYLRDAFALAEPRGYAWGLAYAHLLSGATAVERGRDQDALDQFAACLDAAWRLGDLSFERAALLGLAIVATRLGAHAPAVSLFGAATRLAERGGREFQWIERQREEALKRVHAQVSDGDFARLWDSGHTNPSAEPPGITSVIAAVRDATGSAAPSGGSVIRQRCECPVPAATP